MIEIITLNYLNVKLSVPVFTEKPSKPPKSYVLIEKVGSGETEHLPSATIAFKSYAESLYSAALLNKELKETMKNIIELDEIRGITLNSDYNFTDTRTKEYRYQAVYDIRYY